MRFEPGEVSQGHTHDGKVMRGVDVNGEALRALIHLASGGHQVAADG